MKAMKVNTGGNLAPEEVIGRDQLITKIWDILEQQSVILSSERRMGKTSIIKKMQAEGKDNQLIILRNIEHIKSPIEFVEVVWEDVEKYLSKSAKTTQKVKQFLNQFQDAEFNGFKLPKVVAPHWKILLRKTTEDLLNNQDHQVIFLWDEMPHMLKSIKDREAMEVLDTLRSLRQTYPQVRMVFTGSIGLHHVVKKLKQAGYSNDPTNDIYTIDVPPLSLIDATELTTRLIEGEKIKTNNIEIIAQEIAESVSCIPFYIHHLINEFKYIDNVIDKTTVEKTINELLKHPSNPLKMEHSLERINDYYTDEQKKYALEILNILAVEEDLSFNELWNRLALNPKISDEEMARSVLRLLLKDNYLIRDEKIFKFSRDIFRKYWKFVRML